MLLTDLFEAKISSSKVGAATVKILSYLERALGAKLVKLGKEHYHNSAGDGWGERYVLDGTVECIRFNWAGTSSSEIESVDIWTGSSRDPNFNVKFNGVSLVKSLPELVKVLQSPKVGKHKISGEAVTEAKKGEYDEKTSIEDMITKLDDGRTFTRSTFVDLYHPLNAHAFDDFIKKYGSKLDRQGSRYSLPDGVKFADIDKPRAGQSLQGGGGGSEGSLDVTRGGRGEDYDVDVPEVDKVSFNDSLEHLEGLTEGLIHGSFNALFVAGRGGTGKTQTVEDVLAKNGLSDGSGYFKNTGSASPIGVYTLLYKYRDKIILFDDSDGALADQDARNLIKAATDTKKVRKIAWNKKSAGMYDPDAEGDDPEGKDDEEREDGEDGDKIPKDPDRVPRYFNFTGQIIFISNLSLDKLDPDGALRTRAFVIAINPTKEEMLDRMEQILHTIKLENGSLDKKQREEVMGLIKTSKRSGDASLRTLVRALNLAASKAKNWQKLVELYA